MSAQAANPRPQSPGYGRAIPRRLAGRVEHEGEAASAGLGLAGGSTQRKDDHRLSLEFVNARDASIGGGFLRPLNLHVEGSDKEDVFEFEGTVIFPMLVDLCSAQKIAREGFDPVDFFVARLCVALVFDDREEGPRFRGEESVSHWFANGCGDTDNYSETKYREDCQLQIRSRVDGASRRNSLVATADGTCRVLGPSANRAPSLVLGTAGTRRMRSE